MSNKCIKLLPTESVKPSACAECGFGPCRTTPSSAVVEDTYVIIHPPRIVVCAANRYGNLVFTGIRHFCSIMYQNMRGYDIPALRKQHGEEQGFVDQQGVFMTREEAWGVALAAGQIRRRVGGDKERLYSENLY